MYVIKCFLSLTGPVASIVCHRWSHRTSTILGGIITSTGLFLSAFSTSVNYLIVTFGVISGNTLIALALIEMGSTKYKQLQGFRMRRALDSP